LKTNNQKGQRFVILIGAYLIAKPILNLLLGAGFLTGLIQAIVFTVLLISGMEYINYAVAAILTLTALSHIKNNIDGLGRDWRYIIWLIEGLGDIAVAVSLCIIKDIKEHFTNSWDEVIAEVQRKINKK